MDWRAQSFIPAPLQNAEAILTMASTHSDWVQRSEPAADHEDRVRLQPNGRGHGAPALLLGGRFMSIWLALSTIASLLLGTPQLNWIPFPSRVGGFVVTMPDTPRERVKTLMTV